MQVVAIAPPSSDAIVRVVAGHRELLGDAPTPATPMERTAIAGALARGWSVEDLVDAARGQAMSALNVDPKRRTATFVYATSERTQGCLDVWRKHVAKLDAAAAAVAEREAARRLAAEARRVAPPAPPRADVGGIPIADAAAFGRAEALKRARAELEAANERFLRDMTDGAAIAARNVAQAKLARLERGIS
jgi:hypothetical protein